MCAWALLSELNHILKFMYYKAISRLKTGYFELLTSMAKGVPAGGLLLNCTCCIDLPDCIASFKVCFQTHCNY